MGLNLMQKVIEFVRQLGRQLKTNVLLLTCGLAALPVEIARAEEAPLFAAKIHITSTDAFYKAGTIFEAVDAAGKAVVAAGFPDIFNTVHHHNDSQLSLFVRDGNDKFEITDMGKPPGWMTGSLLVAGGRLTAVNRTIGWDRAIYDAARQRWIQLSKPAFAAVRSKALGVNLGEVGTDCGWVMTLRITLGLLGNCVVAMGKHLSLLGGVANVQVGQNERLRPFFAANGWILMQYVSENSAEKAIVACRYRNDVALENCVVRRHESAMEFAYAIASDVDRVIISTNIGNVFAISNKDGSVTTLRESDGTSYQLYTAAQFRDQLIWGHYPGAEILTLDKGEEFSLTLPRLPIDHYRESAKAELQSFAIYKGELMAGTWPFGEVYRLAPEASEWKLLHRFFPGGAVEAGADEPYQQLTGSNEFGQRITDMVVLNDSLYIATGSKSGLPAPKSPPPELSDVLAHYGKIYRVRSSGALTVALNQIAAPDGVDIEVRVYVNRLDVRDGKGNVIARTNVIGDLRCIADIKIGSGTFGRLTGASVNVDFPSRGKRC